MLFYRVNSLPDQILLGKQTETGVQEIGFDCTAWLNRWPGLAISILVTPPGGAVSYPAETHMEGNTCVWTVNGSDTAAAGNGSMEIVGVADGLKKLSMTCGTRIISTNTDTTSEPPEAAQPWVDKVLDAAAQVAETAPQAVDAAARAEAVMRHIEGNTLDYNNLVNRPCGVEVSAAQNLFFHGASFTNNEYEITEPLPGPLIVGGIYSLSIQRYGITGWADFTGNTAVSLKYNGVPYTAVGNVGGLSDELAEQFGGIGPQPIVFLLNPDNKPDANGVYGKIVDVKGNYVNPPTIRLRGKCEIITPLPKKFLPDDVGGGLPTGGAANQMLVTDANGNAEWQDRTHWKDYSNVILPETTVTVNADMGFAPIATSPGLELGKEYIVVYNGAKYACTAVQAFFNELPVVAIGNMGAMDSEYFEVTGEPFIFGDMGSDIMGIGASSALMMLDGSTSASVEIRETVYHKLDKGYLPNGFMPVMIVNITGGDGYINVTDGWTADKTYDEVLAAHDNGCMVYFKRVIDNGTSYLMPLVQVQTTSDQLRIIWFGIPWARSANYVYVFAPDGTFDHISD